MLALVRYLADLGKLPNCIGRLVYGFLVSPVAPYASPIPSILDMEVRKEDTVYASKCKKQNATSICF